MRSQVWSDEDKAVRVRVGLPDQWARSTRRTAYSAHPQVEQRPGSVHRREVERERRDAQNLHRARSAIDNAGTNVPVSRAESGCRHRGTREANDRRIEGEISLVAYIIKTAVYECGDHGFDDYRGDGN